MSNLLIFFDSNSIISNNFEIGASVLNTMVDNDVTFLISKVTKDEVISNFNKQRAKYDEELTKAIRSAARFGLHVEKVQTKRDIGVSIEKELVDLNVKVLPIEYANLEFIYQRVVDKKKPFKYKDGTEAGGIKDATIWSSLLKFLDNNELEFDNLIIVTADSDFLDSNSNTLHIDLLNDLTELSITSEKVKVCKSIKHLMEDVIYPKYFPDINDTEVIKMIGRDLEELRDLLFDEIHDDLQEKMDEALHEYLGEEKEPHIQEIEALSDYKVKYISLLDDEEYFQIYLSQKIAVQCMYFVEKSDYISYRRRNISMVDNDWNDYVFLVEEQFYAYIGIDVIYKKIEGELSIDDYTLFADNEFEPVYAGYESDWDEQ